MANSRKKHGAEFKAKLALAAVREEPFYGARRMVAVLRRDGWVVSRKRVRRLMRLMGIEAI